MHYIKNFALLVRFFMPALRPSALHGRFWRTGNRQLPRIHLDTFLRIGVRLLLIQAKKTGGDCQLINFAILGKKNSIASGK
jgi:hypothetical protein